MTGPQGPQGPQGDAGASSLISVTSIAPGTTCPAGGYQIQTGIDLNGDGILESNEVQHTADVCNGCSAPSCNDAGSPSEGGTADATVADAPMADASLADATVADAASFPCVGCAAFPPPGSIACSPATLGAPILAYPLDGTLFPPNLGALEVQFVPPAGATLFEIDFENSVTDVRVETACNPITPVRGGASPGCALALSPSEWDAIAGPNRDGDPVRVTVRATIDGSCVSTSASQVGISFANDDVAGGIYFWESATFGGIGGKTGGIFGYDFSAPAPGAVPVYTSGASGTCVGCHVVSRDGARMVFSYDDPDSDDEFGDERQAVMDLATRTILGGKSISPGLHSFAHDHTKLVASTFKPDMNKSFSVFSGDGATLLATDNLPTGFVATQPNLSADDTSLAFVVPQQNTLSMAGDHHFFGGSLYVSTLDPATNALGVPMRILQPAGTDNYYYPSLAPDGSFLLFDHASSGDAFHNPNARVQLAHLPSATIAQPIDLPALNAANGLTNSSPTWSPFVQTYKGHRLLWVTFSSTRDYGLRLANAGFQNCYPPESPAYDQPQPLSTLGGSYQDCSQPQLWMAGVIVDPDPALDASDRSFVAFWLPFQDVTAHNHTAQWVQQVQTAQPPDGGMCTASGGACGGANPECCTDQACCSGACAPTCQL